MNYLNTHTHTHNTYVLHMTLEMRDLRVFTTPSFMKVGLPSRTTSE